MLLEIENNYVIEHMDLYLPDFYSEFYKQQQKIISNAPHNNTALKYSAVHLKMMERNKIMTKIS